MPRSLVGPLMVAGVALIAVACGGAASPTAAGATAVAAELKEFSITLDKTTVPAGDVNFVLSNTGTEVHEFVVLDTDTPAADLPLDSSGTEVDEGALTVVDEVEDIAPAATPTLSIDNLAAGHYAIICNVAGHFQGGMHLDLTVQ